MTASGGTIRAMGHLIEKCQHGVVVAKVPREDPIDLVTTVPCPPTCGVRVLAEETMAELPFENAHLGRMRRENRQEAEGRFRGHDPYREL